MDAQSNGGGSSDVISKSRSSDRGINRSKRVGVVYDERMCQHAYGEGTYEAEDDHPEQPERIRAVYGRLRDSGVLGRCVEVQAMEAHHEQLLRVHTPSHVQLIRDLSSPGLSAARRRRRALSFNSIYFSRGSSLAALLSAGSVVQVTEMVASGELDSGVAIVRPPGHHAEPDKPMGFCLFNNVAIAAKHMLCDRPELGVQKILIVDWDVHHGNGTQTMFWRSPEVLYFSVHRFDAGTFYPTGDGGSYQKIGEGPGKGYNINVPWEHAGMGDSDYLAVWDHILLPVAKSYDPHMILISGGFDAAKGDPLGGCCVTPYGYSLLMKKLMEFANGKIVLALEGGYNLKSLSNSFMACVETLLEKMEVMVPSKLQVFKSTWHIIEKVRKKLCTFWPCLCEDLPLQQLLESALDSPETVGRSASEDEKEYKEPVSQPELTTDALATIVEPLAALSVDDYVENLDSSDRCGTSNNKRFQLQLNEDRTLKNNDTNDTTSVCTAALSDKLTILSNENDHHDLNWISAFSNVYVWYACYGSNMWSERFLCYIAGGKVEGMDVASYGCTDKTPPEETHWHTLPHRMFFGRTWSKTWGHGGVAFLHPHNSSESKSYVRLYKIKLTQFNDLLAQENGIFLPIERPLIDSHAINSMKNGKPVCSIIKGSWYGTVVYIGEKDDLPILTFTCSEDNVREFATGRIPICPPSHKYANALCRGLIDERGLSETDAKTYLEESSKALSL